MSATSQGVYEFAKQNTGNVIGDGQCWTMVEAALESANGQTSTKIMKGKVGPNLDYIWGTPLGTQVNAQAKTLKLEVGDIIQFRDYTCRLDDDEPGERPHHTAIVSDVSALGTSGLISVYESNVPDGAFTVQQHDLYIRSGVVDGVSIKVKGKMWFYRPKSN